MRESNILYLNSTITHMLNCLFGRKMHINILEAGKNPESNNKTDTGEGKKKKNKKKET